MEIPYSSVVSRDDVIKVIDDEPIIRSKAWVKNKRIAKNVNSVIIEYLAESFLGFAKRRSQCKILHVEPKTQNFN